MTTAALALNLLLALLLVAALVMGWRVERRLKALRASHDGFARAVADLDAAAARAEQGLADLRAATDEASESLADRIKQAKTLVAKLDERIEGGAQTVQHAARLAAEAAERTAERAAQAPEPAQRISRVESFRRVLEEPRMSPALRLRERLASEDFTPLKLTDAPVRSKARVDDDLFEEPLRMATGGR
ncbi:MAG: flagellar positioning protein PflI [Caulobacter sp.]|nr:flagellar positioning protein PflI [Caulobacter sp.]